jgi:hypothetical protein
MCIRDSPYLVIHQNLDRRIFHHILRSHTVQAENATTTE